MEILATMPKLISYRQLVYFVTVLTGFCALCAQVVWQRYLSVLVGSEARSLTLVVAVFLLGLASGYYVFGRLTERKWSRFWLLKIYGYTELLTGLYIFFFYLYFDVLKALSFQGPSHLLFDLLISFLALLLPTFLMGASIPVLTTVLPENSREISFIHSRVYGWNTLGAFGGALISGFFLLPTFGLPLTLMIAGSLNVLASLVYIGNKLDGAVHRQEAPPVLPSEAPNWFYLLFTFFAGGVIVSFEILLVRVLNLSIGAGIYNFPMILSIFVGALAVGSLSLKGREFSVDFLIRQVLITLGLLGVLYVTAPYWSIWLSHVRISMATLPSNYYVYKVLVYLFLLLFLAPAIFFMGRLLPLVYALLRKDQDNYGRVCGQLYFFNTLGTVLGTVLIGYLAFYWLDLDQLFMTNLFVLLGLCLAVSLFEKRRLSVALSAALAVTLIALPGWDRAGHYIGYFRNVAQTPEYFKDIFYLPSDERNEVLFFEDGPNTTTTILRDTSNSKQYDQRDARLRKLFPDFQYNYSLVVNGKSDGSLIGDFSTMMLTASLPYLHAPARPRLSAAVIGLGTGVTAGALGRLDDVEQVVVLEISSKVADGIRQVKSSNFDPLSNPKVQLIESDAFRYFTKSRQQFDFIVSEPSNPWVTGVENLFSRDFYQLVSESLSEGGVLCQWLQFYEFSADTMRMVFNTLKQEFRYVEAYKVANGDLLLLSSHEPLNIRAERFSSPFLRPIHRALGLRNVRELELLRVYDWERLSRGVAIAEQVEHTLVNPKLTYKADRAFFMRQSVDPWEIYPSYLMVSPARQRERAQIVEAYMDSLSVDPGLDPWVDADELEPAPDSGPDDATRQAGLAPEEEPKQQDVSESVKKMIKQVEKRCMPLAGYHFFCAHMKDIITDLFVYNDSYRDVYYRFISYHNLRRQGLLPHEGAFLQEVRTAILDDAVLEPFRLIGYYADHLLSQGQFDQARQDVELFKQRELLEDKDYAWLKARIEGVAEQG